LPLRVRWLLLRVLHSGSVSLACPRRRDQTGSYRAEDLEISEEIPAADRISPVELLGVVAEQVLPEGGEEFPLSQGSWFCQSHIIHGFVHRRFAI